MMPYSNDLLWLVFHAIPRAERSELKIKTSWVNLCSIINPTEYTEHSCVGPWWVTYCFGTTVTLLPHLHIAVPALRRLEELGKDGEVKLEGLIAIEKLGAGSMPRLFLFCTHLIGPVEETGTSALEQELLIVCNATFGELAGVLHPVQGQVHTRLLRKVVFQACFTNCLLSKDKSHMTTDTRWDRPQCWTTLSCVVMLVNRHIVHRWHVWVVESGFDHVCR